MSEELSIAPAAPPQVETWRPVVGYEGLYSVSDLGRVRGEHWRLGPRISKGLSPQSDGYVHVGLSKNGKQKSHMAHRLVAFAFIGRPRTSRHQVNHKNGIRHDNRPENLEWVTPRQNVRHSVKFLGRPVRNRARLTAETVREIRLLRKSLTIDAISAQLGVSLDQVGRVVRRKSYAHIDQVPNKPETGDEQ